MDDVDIQPLVEFAIREAIAIAMNTPYREPIVDGVEASGEVPGENGQSGIAFLGASVVSFALGYLLGRALRR